MRSSVLLTLILLAAAPAPALLVELDYTYDTTGFFSQPQRRQTLQTAAETFALLADPLLAIEPGGINQWSARIVEPATLNTISISNPTIAAGTIRVYVGASSSLASSTLAFAGPGGYSASGTSTFLDTLSRRGQANVKGADATDFGPWGGYIIFNANKVWNFADQSLPVSGQNDLYSVAIHEFGHILGVGTADSWDSWVQTASHLFTGPNSEASHGGPVPLHTDNSHWQNGLLSTVGDRLQEASEDPSILVGSRKLFTELDYAALGDIGWEAAIPGDTDADGDVDADDLDRLQNALASGRTLLTWRDGDFDLDTDVDFSDFAALSRNFGRTVTYTGQPAWLAALASSPTAVPEPATLGLLAIGGLLLGRRRRGGRG